MLPKVLLAGDRWGTTTHFPDGPPYSAWGWSVPMQKPLQKQSSFPKREDTNFTWSWGANYDNVQKNCSLDTVFCLLPLLLMVLNGHADTHNFQAATVEWGKSLRLKNISLPVEPLNFLHWILGQMIKYYSSKHHYDRQSVRQGQRKEELVPCNVCFLSLVLQVPSLW